MIYNAWRCDIERYHIINDIEIIDTVTILLYIYDLPAIFINQTPLGVIKKQKRPFRACIQ